MLALAPFSKKAPALCPSRKEKPGPLSQTYTPVPQLMLTKPADLFLGSRGRYMPSFCESPSRPGSSSCRQPSVRSIAWFSM